MKKFFSVVFSLLFLLSLGLAIFLVSLEMTLLQPSFHTKNLKEINIYQRVGGDIIPSLLMQGEGSPVGQLPLAKEDFGEIIQESLPSGWLDGEVERNIENVFAYLKGKDNQLQVSFNLAPVKEGNLGQNLSRGFREKLEELPACSMAEMQRMQAGEVTELKCLPPQVKEEGLPAGFEEQFSGVTQNIPDRLDLSEELPQEAVEKLQEVQRGYQLFRVAMWSLIALTVILFAALVLLNKESILGYFKGLSVALLILSVISFGLQTWVSSNVLQILPPLPSGEAPALDAVRNDLISVTVSSFLSYTSNITLGIFALSILFLIFFVLKNSLGKETPAA